MTRTGSSQWRTNKVALKTFKVDGLNELTNVTGISGALYYDGNGNLTSGDKVTYTWDDENRLVQRVWNTHNANHPADGAQQTDFVYDGQGRLRVRTEYVFSQAVDDWVWESQTSYVYDGMRVIQVLRLAKQRPKPNRLSCTNGEQTALTEAKHTSKRKNN